MTISQQQDRRQHVRTRVFWPVIVEAESERYLSHAVDISSHGAKVKTNARLNAGTAARLQILPPTGPRLKVDVLVWRVDTDGLAFLFSRPIEHQSIPVV